MSNLIFEGFEINKVLNRIINERDIDGNEKFILITISFYHNKKLEGNPAISLPIDKFAELLNCSKATAYKVLKKLIDKGYLKSIRKGQGNPNIYVFKGWEKWQ